MSRYSLEGDPERLAILRGAFPDFHTERFSPTEMDMEVPRKLEDSFTDSCIELGIDYELV
jgi:hypothetical protein